MLFNIMLFKKRSIPNFYKILYMKQNSAELKHSIYNFRITTIEEVADDNIPF